jgi:adenosylmethionine-8-amino-7-oxononanoate aminotransferase
VAIEDACIEAGLLVRTINDNTLQISPPFVVTDDEVSFIGKTIHAALDAYPA